MNPLVLVGHSRCDRRYRFTPHGICRPVTLDVSTISTTCFVVAVKRIVPNVAAHDKRTLRQLPEKHLPVAALAGP